MKPSLFILALVLMFTSCEKPPIKPSVTPNPSSEIDIIYGDHALQTMKLYLPENHTIATKVVVMVHGGGWVMGYHPDEKVTTFGGRLCLCSHEVSNCLL